MTAANQRDEQGLAQFAVAETYKRTRVPLMDKGYRLDLPGEALAVNESPQLLNVIVLNGVMQPDTGYGLFGSVLTPYFGTVAVAFQIFDPSGISQVLLITTRTVYLYDNTLGQWQIAPWLGFYDNPSMVAAGAMSITLSAVALAASATFTFAAQPVVNDALIFDGTTVTFVASGATGNQVNIGGSLATTIGNLLTFLNASSDVNIVKMTYGVSGDVLTCTAATAGTAGNLLTLVSDSTAVTASSPTLLGGTQIGNGSFLGLPLDDGEQLPVTVTGVLGDVVSFTPAVPTGRNVPANSNICLGIALNGTLTNQVAIVQYPPLGWTVISNNVDQVFYWNSARLTPLPTQVTPTTCVDLFVFHESLFLVAPTENGTALPQRVRQSDAGNPTAWTSGAPGSIAAIYDLLDTEDFILKAAGLGPYFILYRETTIMRGTYLGVLGETIFWEYMVDGDGAISTGAVTEITGENEFVGQGNIYQYEGGYTLNDVGDQVFNPLLSANGNLNSALKSLIFAQYVQDYDEILLFYPSGSNTLPDQCLRHHLQTGGWFQREFANKFVSAAFYVPTSDTTWAGATGTWAQNNFAWNSRAFRANIASLLLCAADDNLVFLYDYRTQTDNGVAIPWTAQTKDVGDGDAKNRWDSVRLYGQGTGTISCSIDAGATWATVGSFALGATTSALQILYFQAVSPYIRFMLSGTDPTFKLNWLEVWSLPESEW
jgi:hypothetical protein